VLNLHGFVNDGAQQAAIARMSQVADAEGFVVAYPYGFGSLRNWNAGDCCGFSPAEMARDDVGFLDDVIEHVAGSVCVDRSRIYATGFSNGGFMAHRLACETADLFAAFAPVSAGNGAPACAPSRPVPVIGFHGDGDTVIRYGTGEAGMRGWVERNGCTGRPERVMIGRSFCDRWSTCRGGVAVEFCTDVGGWHLWPSQFTAHPASPAIWEFLMRYTLD
jgi:polyhydroxybutyrate depolymerase